MVPTVAILFAGSGLLTDSFHTTTADAPARAVTSAAGSNAVAPTPQPAVAPAPVEVDVEKQRQLEQIASLQAALEAAREENAVKDEIVARQATTMSVLSELQPTTPLAQPAAPQAVAEAPAVVIAAAPQLDTRQAALTTTPLAAQRFETGQTVAEDTTRCMQDLRNLANQAVIYFPSGGITADAGGIEQGRLIGLVAQSCRGVRIRVEGHSDASGDPGANLRLSEQRANQVIQRIAASGIDTSMFFAEGRGDRQPSGVVGPEPQAFYDRRVEFSIVEEVTQAAVRNNAGAASWIAANCVSNLERAINGTHLFYAPRSVALPTRDMDRAMGIAKIAMDCPHARLRIVGHHSADVLSGETPETGRLRAKALRSMLVGRGVTPEQVIIAARSWPLIDGELPGSRVSFDLILEEK